VIKLIESGLFGNRLVPVDSTLMVERYNSCLVDIGLSPTKLTNFHIDGWGWSPEIAEEQDNSFYLSHGLANPYGIIITPEQENASIYFPYQSFDWDIHEHIFRQYLSQIKDVTAQCGIWFELDQQISAYRSPQDLLMVDVFTVKFKTVDRIMEAAREQRALIHHFNETDFAWADEDVRNSIIESGKIYGDLRFRTIDLPAMPFGKYRSFYTMAFNGMYVLSDLPNGKPLLVYGNNSSKISGALNQNRVEFNLNDPGLISFLYNEKLIEDDIDFFATRPYLIELKMSHLLIEAAEKINLKIPDHLKGQSRKNMILNALLQAKALDDDKYFEFERIMKALNSGPSIDVNDQVKVDLLHPAKSLSSSDKIVMWHLLSNLANGNPVLRYLFDKARFFNEYKTWTDRMQRDVVEGILKHRHIFQELIN